MKYAKSVNGKIYYRDFAKTIISGKLDNWKRLLSFYMKILFLK